MMDVRIYQPTKTAMQSGRAKTKRWKLEFVQRSGNYVEPLMGWVGMRDTQQQLNLWFETQDQAISYAQEHGLRYSVQEPHKKIMRPKSYASNFRYDQVRKTS
jgi:hypothetical protein